MTAQDSKRAQLAAVILTKNVAKHIVPCIETLRFAGRIVVSDSYSTDGTMALAQSAGAEVVQRSFDNFAGQRNAAMEAVDAEWIFFVDADERATPELAEEIRQIIGVEGADIVGWHVPRHNYLFGKLTHGAGYWPDYQMRLLKRGCARYDRPASEIVELDGRSDYLQNALLHYNYESVAQFKYKQTFRIDFEATNLYQRGEKCQFYSPYYMTLRHFWWRYVTLKGYRDGLHGLRLCLLLAYYFGYRYYKRLGQLYRSGAPSPHGSHKVP
jgi:glycosyltransferase involved in cell wall biosynthesis